MREKKNLTKLKIKANKMRQNIKNDLMNINYL